MLNNQPNVITTTSQRDSDVSISIHYPEEHSIHVPVYGQESYEQTNQWLIRSSTEDLSSPPLNQAHPLPFGTAPTSPISPTSPYPANGSPFSPALDGLSFHSPVSPPSQFGPVMDDFGRQYGPTEFMDKSVLSSTDPSQDLLFSSSSFGPNHTDQMLDTLDAMLYNLPEFAPQINQPNHEVPNIPINVPPAGLTIQPVNLFYHPVQQPPVSPSLLQVPQQTHDFRRYSAPITSNDVNQFRSQHIHGSHSVDASPFETEYDDDVTLSLGGNIGRSQSYGGKSNRRPSISSAGLSRSQSVRGRALSRGSSRASSRNSSVTRQYPYPPSGSPSTISEHPSPSPTALADPNLRDELIKLFYHVQTGNEISSAETDRVNNLCKLHSETILQFEPIVSAVAEQTAGKIAAIKRRREPTKMYRCFLCADELTAKHNFTRHFLSHYGIKRFRCDGCGESSTTKSDLKRHEKKCEEVRRKAEAEFIQRSQPAYLGFR